MKPRITSVIWNIRKHKTPNQNSEKKKETPNEWRQCKEPRGQLQKHQHAHHGVPDREEREQGIENLLEK